MKNAEEVAGFEIYSVNISVCGSNHGEAAA